MSTHIVCCCNSEDCRVNGCQVNRQRNEAGGFYAADRQGRGGPAFPVWELNGSGIAEMTDFGMNLRDYFAAKVCAVLLTPTSIDDDYPNLDYQHQEGAPTVAERVATIAYRMADAMLKARDET